MPSPPSLPFTGIEGARVKPSVVENGVKWHGTPPAQIDVSEGLVKPLPQPEYVPNFLERTASVGRALRRQAAACSGS